MDYTMTQPPLIQGYQPRRPKDKSLLIAGAATGGIATVLILIFVASAFMSSGSFTPTILSPEKKIVREKLREEHGSNSLKIHKWKRGKSYVGKKFDYITRVDDEYDLSGYENVRQKGHYWKVSYEVYYPLPGWIQKERKFYFEDGKLVQIGLMPVR